MFTGALSFLVTVAYLPGVVSVQEAGRWSVLAIGVALALWRVRIQPGAGHWTGLLFLCWCAVGLFEGVQPFDTAGRLFQLTLLGGVFLLGAAEQDLRPFWTGICWGVIVNAVVVLIQWSGLNPVYSVDHSGLPAGLFGTRNALNEIVAVGLIGALAIRAWWALPAPLVCLAITGNRTAVLMLVAAAVMWVWIRADRFTRTVIGFLVVFVPVVVIPVLDLHAGWFRTMDRVGIWLDVAAWLPWRDPYLLAIGYGLGTLGSVVPSYEFAHSEPLQLFFETGIGVFMVMGVFGYALAGSGRPLYRCALGAVAAASLVWFPLHMPATAMVAAMLAGHLCGAGRRHGVCQSDRGARSVVRVQDGPEEALGAGAICVADLGRIGVPIRQEPAARR